jgi:PAS domain S-box-containing protein
MLQSHALSLKDTIYKAAIDFTEGVVLLDANGVIIDANDRYCKLYGLSAEQVGKVDFGSTLDDGAKKVFLDFFDGCKISKKVFRAKLRKQNITSGISIIETTGVPFFDKSGKLTETLLLVADITHAEMVQRKKVLELLKQRQSALDKIRADKKDSDEQIAKLQSELEADKAQFERLNKELKEKQTKIDIIAIRVQEAQLSLSFENALAAEIHRSKRYKRPLCVVFFGIDRMESLMLLDTHSSDRVFISFYTLVKGFVRLCDLLFLEKSNAASFMLLLPETPGEGAKRLCEKIQEHLAHKMPSVFGKKITCSFVVVEFNESTENHSDVIEFARRKFQELNESKSQQRGEIILL